MLGRCSAILSSDFCKFLFAFRHTKSLLRFRVDLFSDEEKDIVKEMPPRKMSTVPLNVTICQTAVLSAGYILFPLGSLSPSWLF